MLDTDTKRRIDTARDILVGKLPDPKSQVEQITIALIYKFMDDMDAEAEELGGTRTFFAGDFQKYGWSRLLRGGLGGHEMLGLYAEGITRMPENPGIPPLFRDIFKNAYLPYRDPETLRAFLKVIDDFEYDHSEHLGDAYEYLLSVLGSQGDAGQFRTPRHIIDFIVSIIDPKKHETILDPACGTAGFLISSYKHILKENTDQSRNSTLTPDERERLAANFRGYDISPDMVRLSLVNMYLHGFANPQIHEYDTLTSQDRWNDYADVFFANPPFMSPKGGVQPHSRFSVQSKRSEVLFVDYIAEHLTPGGRAGIIVPEGIIFQSQSAYTQLRKMLVEEYLVAVVSLPGGVFNPYSGVKTSILILDRTLAKVSSTIAFLKTANDGFGLGAQRRPIANDDLPQARAEITEYLRRARAGESLEDFQPTLGLVVPKERIGANGDYNLAGERYRDASVSSSTFPSVTLGDVSQLVRGVVYSKEDEVVEGGVQVLRASNINRDRYGLDLNDVKRVAPKTDFSDDKRLRRDDIFICLASGSKDHIGKVALIRDDTAFYFGGFMGVIRVNPARLHPGYLFRQLTTRHFNDFLREQIASASINNLSSGLLHRFTIPLPPLKIQKEIAAEVEGYQKVIDGARAVIDNYRPRISFDEAWPIAALGDHVEILDSRRRPITKQDRRPGRYPYYGATGVLDHVDGFLFDEPLVLVGEDGAKWGAGEHTAYAISGKAWVNNHAHVLRPRRDALLDIFLITALNGMDLSPYVTGVTVPKLNQEKLRSIRIPLPPLATQQIIVAELEVEQRLVSANRELVERIDNKIQKVLAHTWGVDDKPQAATEAASDPRRRRDTRTRKLNADIGLSTAFRGDQGWSDEALVNREVD